MSGQRLEDWGERALTSTVANRFMPDQDVAERTQATYIRGAAFMLRRLSSGDLSPGGPDANFDANLMGEFLSRVVQNAEAQGIEIRRRPSEAAPEPHSK